jgi:8-hydroxy-5-deazaflavin:NADPH oxidoreductase
VQNFVAIVGGTGAEGSGLAARLAKVGVEVRIGSRNLEKAQDAARRIGGSASGHTNAEAASGASIVILTVPLSAQVETLKSIRGHIAPDAVLVDATVPLEVAIGGRVSRTVTLWDGSAAQQAARLLPGIPVVAAFHALSAEALANLDRPLDCDALVCGDNADAKAKVSALAQLIPGVRAIDAGPLDNARLLESAAALLISLNLRHKVKESGMRITGL